MKPLHTRLGMWFLWTAVLSQVAMGVEPTTLSATDKARFEELKSKKLQQFRGHADLAEYMNLRKLAAGSLPSPAEDVAHYAIMRLGQPYLRGAWSQDLAASDCVSLTEFCISRACADNWQTAHRLLNRLRFKNGTGRTADLNREPILDWIPSNAWLFDEITNGLGAATSTFNAEFEGRSASTSYIPKEKIPDVFKQLRTGDLMFVIADSVIHTASATGPAGTTSSVVFYRDPQNRIYRIVDPMGKSIYYKYDDNGDLISVTDRTDRTVGFKYDNHNLTEIITADGNPVAHNVYDENGRLVAHVDANGKRIEYDHDGAEVEGLRPEVVTDRSGNPSTFWYDPNGYVAKKVESIKDESGAIEFVSVETTYEHDDLGHVTETVDALGRSTRQIYAGKNLTHSKSAS